MVVRVEVPVDEAEVAADLLWQAGATAVGEAADGSGTVALTADLERCPPEVARRGWSVVEWVDDGAWQDGWRTYARAVRAGVFLVRPPWVPAPTEGAEAAGPFVELVVDGGRAFGTGSHPSTTLALEALPDVVRPGDDVVDVGCGSGALAVGAALLGAGRVVAVDIDPAAVEATTRNAAANGVRVEVAQGDASEVDGPFDVVLANLGSPLVFELASVLLAATAPGGALVLSGLLDERAGDVHAAYPAMECERPRSRDGWSALVLRRPDRRR